MSLLRNTRMIVDNSISDVMFVVEGKKIPSSKALLANSSSKFFQAMFSRDYQFKEMRQHPNEPIPISNVTARAFKIILNFIERRTISSITSLEEAEDLIETSHYFVFEDLALASQGMMIKFLTIDNVCSIWNKARQLHWEVLSEGCEHFFTSNFTRVVATPDFLLLDREALHGALSSGNIDCSDEFILGSLRSWGKYHLWSLNGSSFNRPLTITEGELKTFIQDLLPPNTLFSYRNKMTLLQSWRAPIF